MMITVTVLLIALVGFAAYVRLAPADWMIWDGAPSLDTVWEQGAGWNEVIALTGGALLRIPAADGLLARLDAIAMATPRTKRLSGSVAEGRIVWVTRSALWGFPDYTTAQSTPEGVYLHARLRFGQSDLGVNAARLTAWQASL